MRVTCIDSGPFLNEAKASYNILVGCVRQLLHSMTILQPDVPEAAKDISVGKGLHDLLLYADSHWLEHALIFFDTNNSAHQRLEVLQLLSDLAAAYNLPNTVEPPDDGKFRNQLLHFAGDSRLHWLCATVLSRLTVDQTTRNTTDRKASHAYQHRNFARLS